jgi:hypothetical protein
LEFGKTPQIAGPSGHAKLTGGGSKPAEEVALPIIIEKYRSPCCIRLRGGIRFFGNLLSSAEDLL